MRIAFAATQGGATDLYVMAPNGSGVARLTSGIGVLGSPAWSPDGTRIAFDCRLDAGNDDICVVNADGSAAVRLTNDPARDYGAAWKPDGSTLAFATTRYGSDEVVLMSPGGGSVTRIGAGIPGLEPTWSPDGTQIALVQHYTCGYYDYCSGYYDAVFVAHSDGSNLRYLTEGNQPAWRPHP
jgi:TolB protein